MTVRRAVRILLAPIVAVLVTALAACGSSGSGSGSGGGGGKTGTESGGQTAKLDLNPAFGSMQGLPGIQDGPPPWTNGHLDLRARLKAIGLPALGQEALAFHIHQHLDLYVHGSKVQVPAEVGIDPTQGFITVLHTHDPTGVIHVESPTEAGYSLGQFFAVWGVPLGPDRIGSLRTGNGNEFKVWINGKPANVADPTRIPLTAHEEIVLAFGTAAEMPKKVRATYDWTGL